MIQVLNAHTFFFGIIKSILFQPLKFNACKTEKGAGEEIEMSIEKNSLQ